jgi:hypothetical protein
MQPASANAAATTAILEVSEGIAKFRYRIRRVARRISAKVFQFQSLLSALKCAGIPANPNRCRYAACAL